jgi:hypothetical protein
MQLLLTKALSTSAELDSSAGQPPPSSTEFTTDLVPNLLLTPSPPLAWLCAGACCSSSSHPTPCLKTRGAQLQQVQHRCSAVAAPPQSVTPSPPLLRSAGPGWRQQQAGGGQRGLGSSSSRLGSRKARGKTSSKMRPLRRATTAASCSRGPRFLSQAGRAGGGARCAVTPTISSRESYTRPSSRSRVPSPQSRVASPPSDPRPSSFRY